MTDTSIPNRPVAAQKPTHRVFHGDDVVDNYEWMRSKNAPETRDFIVAENAYTEARMAPLAGLRQTLFDELKARVQETDMSVPTRMDGYWYFGRTVEGKQYGLQCRIPVTDESDWTPPAIDPASEPGSMPGEEIYFDANKEAAGHDFFRLGTMDLSKDGSLLLYGVDTAGNERYDLRLRVIGTESRGGVAPGDDFDWTIEQIGAGACLSPDGHWVFYPKVDDAWRPYAIWRHEVGTDVARDVEVWHEADERFWAGVGISFDEKRFVIATASKTTSEVWQLPIDNPTGEFETIIPRREGVEYDVSFATFEGEGENGEDIPIALLIHNVSNPNFEVAALDLRTHQAPFSLEEGVTIAQGSTERDDPQIREGLRIDGIEMYRGYTALSFRRDGLPHLAVMTKREAAADFLAGRPWNFHQINPGHGMEPGAAGDKLYSISSVGNPSYDAPRMRYSFGSYTTPGELHEIDPATGSDVLLKRAQVLGDFDASNYSERREWVVATDGTRVPVSLVWRTDKVSFDAVTGRPDAPQPLFITGYGAYEISSDPGFSVGRLSLLDRGVLYAVAHVRGGGEMGRQWYEQGKELTKRNTFTDFVDVTRWLERSGWADASRTVANGGSAGGLLMGAIANLAPDAYAGIEADVPFVDALTSILDPSLPLTVTEWDEWGDPLHNEEVYRYMRSYSPYENVLTAAQRQDAFGTTAFPAVFVTTSVNDTRVMYVEPLKWVARLQEDAVGADALIKVEVDSAGHGGVSGRYKQWEELAYENAWCLSVMGIGE